MDEINLRIIDVLTRDASRPFVEIARELEISNATVHIRVKKMLASGIIYRFTIAADSKLLGYTHVEFMGINIQQGCTDEIAGVLSREEGDTRGPRDAREIRPHA